MDRPILEVRDLVKRFPVARGLAGFFGMKNEVHAVDGVSFDIHKSETFGLVGESGCGKSTTGKLIVRLLEPTSGSIFFDDQDISQLSGRSVERDAAQYPDHLSEPLFLTRSTLVD